MIVGPGIVAASLDTPKAKTGVGGISLWNFCEEKQMKLQLICYLCIAHLILDNFLQKRIKEISSNPLGQLIKPLMYIKSFEQVT